MSSVMNDGRPPDTKMVLMKHFEGSVTIMFNSFSKYVALYSINIPDLAIPRWGQLSPLMSETDDGQIRYIPASISKTR